MGAARGWRHIGFGEPEPVVGDDRGMRGGADEIGPFVGIGLVVVEFFSAVGVADIAPALGPNGVVALVMAGDGGPTPRRIGTFELGNEAETFEIGAGRESSELDEGGIEVEQFGGTGAASTRR